MGGVGEEERRIEKWQKETLGEKDCSLSLLWQWFHKCIHLLKRKIIRFRYRELIVHTYILIMLLEKTGFIFQS